MSILGIDEITFGAQDIARCRQFFLDWGLTLVDETPLRLVYESLNGCRVIAAASDSPDLPPGIEPDPTLREVVWGVDSPESLARYRSRLQGQPGYVDELRALEADIERLAPLHPATPERLFAVLARGDEVLDWREMQAFCAGGHIRLLDGSDHAISDFDDHIDEVFAFLGL